MPANVDFWDRFGISASVLCVIHCLLTPFLLISIPFLGQWISHPWVHLILALIIFPVAIWALWRGYKTHRKSVVLQLGAIGLVFIASGLYLHDSMYEFIFTAVGGVILATAHFKNLRACQSCRSQF